ncbi:hypothetical protein OEZ85_009548 [Tetradesmus obliquus]|uniref:Uncharacterized protein n=1 Tax=Tetradesmus obliquus TaxID=3088 RepID=A0ABY8U9B3_TETOB|nr:hypothetical protein OEZ85_009548 [Tetradesmus obliquus]
MPIGYGHVLTSTANPELRQKTVMHSFLGVGAPEAILVAVVALVVFGPKGLADAAKSLGQTLRAFQPTIREVVEVSQEIKGTLEQELGLDEIRQAATMRPTPKPIRTDTSSSTDDAPSSSSMAASSSGSSNLQPISEEFAKQLDPEIELKRAMSEQAAWGGAAPAAGAAAAAAAAAPEQQPPAAAAAAPAGQDLSKLSLTELEAELARRKNAQQA